MGSVRRILVYAASLGNGGAERVAALLAAGFAMAGHHVTLAVDAEAEENALLIPEGVRRVSFGRSHAAAVRALAERLRSERPDVALAVGAACNVKLTTARMRRRDGPPIVLSYHGTAAVTRGLLGRSAYRFAPVLTRMAAATVCVSDSLVAHMVKDWRAPPSRLHRIYNPIDLSRARPAGSAAELLARQPVVLGMGRLVPDKRFDRLIEAIPLMSHGNARLVIYGEGPERHSLQALAQRLGVSHRVSLPGYVRDPWAAYCEARCFALCSRSEAFGNVVVEALASGLPVVSTRSGGPEEILAGGKFGALLDDDDPVALATALDRCLAKPGEPSSRTGRALDFSAGSAVAAYLDLFESLLVPSAPS